MIRTTSSLALAYPPPDAKALHRALISAAEALRAYVESKTRTDGVPAEREKLVTIRKEEARGELAILAGVYQDRGEPGHAQRVQAMGGMIYADEADADDLGDFEAWCREMAEAIDG